VNHAPVPVRLLAVIAGVLAIAMGAIVLVTRPIDHGAGMDHGPAMTDEEMASIAADMRIAPFHGVDHRGNPIDASDLRGQWTVLSFGFTSCTLACPMLHGEIFRMAEKLASHHVKFLTISVDPTHDTVEQMATYVKPWGMPSDCWTFARVDTNALPEILAGLKLAPITEDPSEVVTLPGGGTMANLHHPTRFFLVGPDGTVRGIWRGSDPDEVDALVRYVLMRVF